MSVLSLCGKCNNSPEMLDGMCRSCWHAHKQQEKDEAAKRTAIAEAYKASELNQNLRKWRYKRREMLVEALGGVCSVCQTKAHFAAFAFIGNPAFPIAQGLSRGYSYGKLLKEAWKCKLLCMNCSAQIRYEGV